MSRIVSASLGTAVWRAGLADPHLHWRRRKSAWEMAVSWESKRDTPSGLPDEVFSALSRHPAFVNPALLIGVVEHRVMLDTPKTPSQNDLWCILSTDSGLVSTAIEAKSGEDFDKRLSDWFGSGKGRAGKEGRLRFLCGVLGIECEPEVTHRYQLFHRAASAVLEAKRWRLATALLLVQSFSESPTSWDDFVAFAGLLGLTAVRDGVAGPCRAGDVALYVAWIDSPMATDTIAAAAI